MIAKMDNHGVRVCAISKLSRYLQICLEGQWWWTCRLGKTFEWCVSLTQPAPCGMRLAIQHAPSTHIMPLSDGLWTVRLPDPHTIHFTVHHVHRVAHGVSMQVHWFGPGPCLQFWWWQIWQAEKGARTRRISLGIVQPHVLCNQIKVLPCQFE